MDKPTDFESRPVNHVIAAGGPRRDRRIMARDRSDESRNHCGAARTAYDLTIASARRDPSWVKCPTCHAFAVSLGSQRRGPSQAEMDRESAAMEAEHVAQGIGQWGESSSAEIRK